MHYYQAWLRDMVGAAECIEESTEIEWSPEEIDKMEYTRDLLTEVLEYRKMPS